MRRVVTKPSLGIQINHGHPLARKLVSCWLFNEMGGSQLSDISVRNNDGVLTDMDPPTDWIGGLHGSALDFDGSDDVVDMGTGGGDTWEWGNDQNFSFMVWAKVPSTAPDTIGDIVNRESTAPRPTWQIIYRGDAGDKQVEIALQESSPNKDSNLVLLNNANDDKWHLYVATIDRSDDIYRGYLDGAEVVTGADGTGTFSMSSTKLGIGAGRLDNIFRFFTGQISDVRVWNRALNAEEVRELFNTPYSMFKRHDIFAYGPVSAVAATTNASFFGAHF